MLFHEFSHADPPPYLLSLLLLLTPLMTACAEEPENRISRSVSWDEPIQVASGDGHRGPWRMNRSAFHYVDDPSAHVTDDGTIGMAWVEQSRQDIFFQRFSDGTNAQLEEPVNVSGTPDVFSWFPDVAVTDKDPEHVYVLWQEIVFSGGSHGGEAFFARSTNGGTSFEEPINLSRSEAGDGKGRMSREIWDNGSLDLAVGPGGHIYAAWTEFEGRLWFRYSTDRGNTFSDPLLLAGGTSDPPARGPSIAVPSPEKVHVVWTVGGVDDADIHIRTVHPEDQSMSSTRTVNRTDGYADAPKITVDRKDRLHVVYGQRPRRFATRGEIRYTRSDDGMDTFTTPRIISTEHTETYDFVNYPSLQRDGNGRLYVLWEILDRSGRYPRPEKLGFTVSTDGGASFAPPSIVPGSNAPDDGFNGSQQGLLMGKLSVNRSGKLAVVNSDFTRNQDSHIWLMTGQFTGQ